MSPKRVIELAVQSFDMESNIEGLGLEEETVQYSDNQSIIEEDEDEVEEKPLQGGAKDQQDDSSPLEEEVMMKAESGPLELIYIMFSFFPKECNELCAPFHCKVRFSISSYIIEQCGPCSKEEFGTCLNRMFEFMKSISVAELKGQGEGEQWRRLKYYYSPHIIQILGKKKIRLALFHNRVYGFSREIPHELILIELINLTKSTLVQGIRFRRLSKNYAVTPNSWICHIYEHITGYLQLILQHYSQFFKERQVIVCIDQSNSHFLLHGQRAKHIMECKTTIKNALESLVCLYVKDTKIDHKVMKKYLKKSTLYPAYYGIYNQSTSVLISKDNIIRQLIQKSNNFMKYLGLQLSAEQSAEVVEPTVGFYIIPSPSIIVKMQKIKQKLQTKCYDIFTNMGIRYFKKVFLQQGKEQEHPFRQLLVDFLLCIEEFKIKYELMKPNKEPLPVKEVDDGLRYHIRSGKATHEELSKALRRDVLTEKIQMKKKFIISYNIVQTPEVPAFWTITKEGEEGEEVKQQELKKGVYLKGHKKTSEKGDNLVFFQELITIL